MRSVILPLFLGASLVSCTSASKRVVPYATEVELQTGERLEGTLEQVRDSSIVFHQNAAVQSDTLSWMQLRIVTFHTHDDWRGTAFAMGLGCVGGCLGAQAVLPQVPESTPDTLGGGFGKGLGEGIMGLTRATGVFVVAGLTSMVAGGIATLRSNRHAYSIRTVDDLRQLRAFVRSK